MPDRLLYQSEAEQLVPERGLVVVEPEVPFPFFLGTSGIQGSHLESPGRPLKVRGILNASEEMYAIFEML